MVNSAELNKLILQFMRCSREVYSGVSRGEVVDWNSFHYMRGLADGYIKCLADSGVITKPMAEEYRQRVRNIQAGQFDWF